MNEHQASRTLLKSLPELWAECSDAQSLAKHLGDTVGEIRITKLEPEHTVAWEGDRASGTVKLEPSGWGTRVRLACSMPEQKADDRHAPEPDPPPAQPTAEATSPQTSEQPPPVPARGRLLQRVIRFLGPGREVAKPDAAEPHQSAPAESPAPEPPAPEPPAPEPPAPESAEATKELDGADPLAAALDSLGQAHHRPFSRA